MRDYSIRNELSARLIKLYIIALSAVAIFLVISQVLVQFAIREQQNDARVVNIAGRQRMLSQKLCKTSILLVKNDIFMPDAEYYSSDIKDIIKLWQQCHYGLKNGRLMLEKEILVKNSDTINLMFDKIEPYFQIMIQNAKIIDHEIEAPGDNKIEILNKALSQVLLNERHFLKTMDDIVFQYDKEAKNRVNYLKNIEFILFIFTIIILIIEAIFIYRPTYQQVNRTINALKFSEKHLQTLNLQLHQANISIKEAENELLKATEDKFKLQIKEDKIRSVSLMEGQEEERIRLAVELHDGIGQMLTGLKLLSEKFTQQSFNTEKDQKTFQDLKQLIHDTIAETRIISFNLMPSVLNDFGIIAAIKLLAEQTEKRTNINITMRSNNFASRLPKNVETTIYRIAQEGLNNVIKHAEASQINIDLRIIEDHAHLSIIDNGKGFDTRKLKNKTLKNGIKNMKSRTEINNGTFKLRSKPNYGTQLSVTLPIIYT